MLKTETNCFPNKPCNLPCKKGFALLNDGMRCECVPPRCSYAPCNLNCKYGQVYDSNGCQLCECPPPSPKTTTKKACPNSKCSESVCPLGLLVDAQGCHTSNCCVNIPCNIKCIYGLIYDSKGCKHCQCIPKAEECPSNKPCNIRCRDGLIYNSVGCQLCQCIPPLNECPTKKSCNLFCKKGFVLNNDDCECKCVPKKECPDLPCFKFIKCAHGQVLDAYGCPTCTCKNL
ncbi:antistasin-like [Gordionus sp. m RMFG-2023]|uniref:antistasin-like n=1 Tax=Gordionus sp. m RMFG-2023 TaxID=3053472 RepID=UPI0031FC8DB9